MIYGIGIDIIEINRIKEILIRKENSLINKILSDNEKKECPINLTKKTEYVAGRFAGKEAFSKAFGTGIGAKIGWKEIEILKGDSGKPIINVRNEACNKDFVYHISISHTETIAVAQVIIEQR